MDQSPSLDYATQPSETPANPGRIALGLAGLAVYGLLLVGCLIGLLVSYAVARRTDVAICFSAAAAVIVWRLVAAAHHSIGGLGRRRR